MSKLLIFLAFIYILASVLKIFISDYDKCYSEMTVRKLIEEEKKNDEH